MVAVYETRRSRCSESERQREPVRQRGQGVIELGLRPRRIGRRERAWTTLPSCLGQLVGGKTDVRD